MDIKSRFECRPLIHYRTIFLCEYYELVDILSLLWIEWGKELLPISLIKQNKDIKFGLVVLSMAFLIHSEIGLSFSENTLLILCLVWVNFVSCHIILENLVRTFKDLVKS